MIIPTIERLRAALAERYETGSELGRGGAATVDAARELKLGGAVATPSQTRANAS